MCWWQFGLNMKQKQSNIMFLLLCRLFSLSPVWWTGTLCFHHQTSLTTWCLQASVWQWEFPFFSSDSDHQLELSSCEDAQISCSSWTQQQRLWKVPTRYLHFLLSQQPIRSRAADQSSVTRSSVLLVHHSFNEATSDLWPLQSLHLHHHQRSLII